MDLIGNTVSNLIKTQFPQQYIENGPLLVSFVTEYFKWMEQKTASRDDFFSAKSSLVTTTNLSPNVVGYGTLFTSQFANSDYIAICTDRQTNDYQIFQVNAVANDTFLTLKGNNLPTASLTKTLYSTVSDKANPLFLSRNYFDIHDVDETFDEYVLFFKEKYLKGLQFKTITDTRKLIKHSLDLYRSKGTERSIDLLWKIVFGKPARVYYPGQDMFRLSAGEWFIPKYLELSLSSESPKLINKEVVGTISGAKAFVEEIIRTVSNNKIIDVAYISAINGDFLTGETVTLPDNSLDKNLVPKIVGSLNEVDIADLGTGQNFEINELVNITSINGTHGIGKVLAVANSSGTLTFSLLDGGYGYTNTANVYVSEKTITLSNATIAPYYNNFEYVPFLNELKEPMAKLFYQMATGHFANSDTVFTYWPNNAIKGSGRILGVSETSDTAGILTIAITSGDMNDDPFFSSANVVAANLQLLGGYTDITATANVIGNYANVTILANNVVGTFEVGEDIVQQGTDSWGVVDAVDVTGSNVSIVIANSIGTFRNGYGVLGLTSGARASVLHFEVVLGVVDIGACSFIVYDNNYANTEFMSGTITKVSTGNGATVTFSGTLDYPETIQVNTDMIGDYESLPLSGTWPFPAYPTANLNTVIDDALTLENKTVGKIHGILATGSGQEYNQAPVIRLIEPSVFRYDIPETEILTMTDATGFQVGELVTQTTTDARGLIERVNGANLHIQRLRFFLDNQFVNTISTGTQIVGSDSGVTSNVIASTLRSTSNRYGDDLEMEFFVVVGEGVITAIQVIDSGLGFANGESVTLSSGDKSGNGTAILLTHGTGSGYYRSKDGFLSDDKKLSDGYYYQEYSYEVRSAVIDDFKATLKNIVHVAGTKYFDALVYDTINPVDTTANTTTAQVTDNPLEYTSNVMWGDTRLVWGYV